MEGLDWDSVVEFKKEFEQLQKLEEKYTNEYFFEDHIYKNRFIAFKEDLFSRYDSLCETRDPESARIFISDFIYHRLLCSHLSGTEDPYLASRTQVMERYEALRTSLTINNNPFLKWLGGQASYCIALEQFRYKKLETVSAMYWGGQLERAEPSFNPPSVFHLPLINKEIVLAAIVADSLLIYKDANRKQLKGYSISKGALSKAQRLAAEMDSIISEDQLLNSRFGELASKLRKRVDVYSDHALWKAELLVVNSRHEKAAREVFIYKLCDEYSKRFFYGANRKSNCELGIAELEYRRPHADVIANITSLVDQQISERKIHETLVRFEAKLKASDELSELLQAIYSDENSISIDDVLDFAALLSESK